MHGDSTRVLRPRTFVYAALLLLLCTGLVTAMATRTPIILDVIRDRNTLFREFPDGTIENSYTLKIINQRNADRSFELEVSGVPGIVLDGVPAVVLVEGGGVRSLPVRARAARDNARGVLEIAFTITDVEDPANTVTEDSRFLGPMP